MFKAFFRAAKIRRVIELDNYIKEIELEKNIDMKRIKERIGYELERRMEEAILKQVEFHIDNEALEKCAKMLVEEYNPKPIIENAVKERMKGYINNIYGNPYQPLALQNANRQY